MASVCDGQILVETIVSPGAYAELHLVTEPPSSDQAVGGIGCRPTRLWVLEALRRHFGYAYATVTRPSNSDFEKDWKLTRSSGNMRAVFVGSRAPLHLQTLTKFFPIIALRAAEFPLEPRRRPDDFSNWHCEPPTREVVCKVTVVAKPALGVPIRNFTPIGKEVSKKGAFAPGYDRTTLQFAQCETCGSVWMTYTEIGPDQDAMHVRITKDFI